LNGLSNNKGGAVTFRLHLYFTLHRDFHAPLSQTRSVDMNKLAKIILSKKGATAIEYGLIAALIAVAGITAMSRVGNRLGTTFNNAANAL
jgi:pilus assembly protein Flp/PilA